jgi:putative transcriptional regulator
MKTRIKEFRARYNITQQQLADKVGATRMTIVYLEKGKYNPSLKLAKKIARALCSTIDELFIFEEKDYM